MISKQGCHGCISGIAFLFMKVARAQVLVYIYIYIYIHVYIYIYIFIIQHIDTLPKYGLKTLDVRRSTWRISNDRCKF